MAATPLAKEKEAGYAYGSTHATIQDAPPFYAGPPAMNQPCLADTVSADMASLRTGDPKETIAVPMIHSAQSINFRKLFSKNRKEVTHSVIVRKMPREWYLKHYAKDADGNYIGTEAAAVDAGLVFVPSKSTPEDLLEQVHKVAFGKEHYANDFSSGLGMISGIGDGLALTSGPPKSKRL